LAYMVIDRGAAERLARRHGISRRKRRFAQPFMAFAKPHPFRAPVAHRLDAAKCSAGVIVVDPRDDQTRKTMLDGFLEHVDGHERSPIPRPRWDCAARRCWKYRSRLYRRASARKAACARSPRLRACRWRSRRPARAASISKRRK